MKPRTISAIATLLLCSATAFVVLKNLSDQAATEAWNKTAQIYVNQNANEPDKRSERKFVRRILLDKVEDKLTALPQGGGLADYNRAMVALSSTMTYAPPDEAVAHLKSAAANGDALSARLVAKLDGEVDAMRLLKAMADEGDPLAAADYANELRFDEDLTAHMKYHRIAADQGMAYSQVDLARALIEDWDDPASPSTKEGLKYLEDAARIGYNAARERLADCYAKAQALCGGTRDNKKILALLRPVVFENAPLQPPPFKMENGVARLWYGNVVSLDNTFPSWSSFQHLLNIYLRGMGVEKNQQEAMNVLAKMDELDAPHMGFKEGETFFTDYLRHRIAKDDANSLKLLRKAFPTLFDAQVGVPELWPYLLDGTLRPLTVVDIAQLEKVGNLEQLLDDDGLPANSLFMVAKTFEVPEELHDPHVKLVIAPNGPRASGHTENFEIVELQQ